MARIKKLKNNGSTIYPATIWNAVVDPDTGMTLKQLVAELTEALNRVDAHTLQGHGIVTAGELDPKNKIPVVGTDGVMEIGRYLDFHMDGSKEDYNIRLRCDTTGKYQLYLPAKTGTVALTSDIPSVTSPICVYGYLDSVDHYIECDSMDSEALLNGAPMYFMYDPSTYTNQQKCIPVGYDYDSYDDSIKLWLVGSDGEDTGVWYGSGKITNRTIGLNFAG